MKCLSCHVEKDNNVLEVYPYPDDQRLYEDPILPLIDLDCQPESGGLWKKVTVCHECFHKLQPDMWIGEKCWNSLNPLTPFNNLPNLYEELNNDTK